MSSEDWEVWSVITLMLAYTGKWQVGSSSVQSSAGLGNQLTAVIGESAERSRRGRVSNNVLRLTDTVKMAGDLGVVWLELAGRNDER